MKKSDLIRATDSFKAFDSFNNLFCNSWLVGILAASKALYHRITIGDAIELFGKNAGVAIDFGLALVAALCGAEKSAEIRKGIVYA